jgi:hypothetical protein
MRLILTAGLLAASTSWSPLLAQPQSHAGHADMMAPATPRLLTGYGSGGFPVTTSNPQAQAFFDNGMQLAAAFAHQAAIDAMKEARRLDPSCAMCAWGEAWTAGPTINFGKSKKEIAALRLIALEARRLAKAHGTPLERQLTKALVKRYTHGGGGGEPGDRAFAKALEKLVQQNPTNDAVAVLAADAVLSAIDRGQPAP